MSWYTRAVGVIEKVHATLPADADEAMRRKALFAAYPFGERRYTPYKIWLKAQREYLTRWSNEPAGPLDARPHLSPLERQALRANVTLSRTELRRRGA